MVKFYFIGFWVVWTLVFLGIVYANRNAIKRLGLARVFRYYLFAPAYLVAALSMLAAIWLMDGSYSARKFFEEWIL